MRQPISHLLQYSACTAHTTTRTHGRHDLSRLVGGVLLWCRGPLELQRRTNSSSRKCVVPLSPRLRTPPGATPSLLLPPENGGLGVDPQQDANADFFGALPSVKNALGTQGVLDWLDGVAGGLDWQWERREGGGSVSSGLEHRTSCLGGELFAKEDVRLSFVLGTCTCASADGRLGRRSRRVAGKNRARVGRGMWNWRTEVPGNGPDGSLGHRLEAGKPL